MNLSLLPTTQTWPDFHYVFIEKIGPFEKTAQKCWEEFNEAFGHCHLGTPQKVHSIYSLEPEMLYRAGASFSQKPFHLPTEFKHEVLKGGKYLCFTLKGSYSLLPEACGKVFEYVEKNSIQPDLKGRFFVENYVNSPATTPEEELITEILVPIK